MKVNTTFPPSLNAVVIDKMRGSDQLRAVASILDQLGNGRVHEDFVMGYSIICNNVLANVRQRLNTAVEQALTCEVVSCLDVSQMQKQESA